MHNFGKFLPKKVKLITIESFLLENDKDFIDQLKCDSMAAHSFMSKYRHFGITNVSIINKKILQQECDLCMCNASALL